MKLKNFVMLDHFSKRQTAVCCVALEPVTKEFIMEVILELGALLVPSDPIRFIITEKKTRTRNCLICYTEQREKKVLRRSANIQSTRMR